ncbi:hypothetical protein GIX45_10390 [Erwinia sp. CPCC 100877]|nr:hypothetical protein [Erwinia sp. CPCC 100877]
MKKFSKKIFVGMIVVSFSYLLIQLANALTNHTILKIVIVFLGMPSILLFRALLISDTENKKIKLTNEQEQQLKALIAVRQPLQPSNKVQTIKEIHQLLDVDLKDAQLLFEKFQNDTKN